jgi:hypothetical protein
MSTQHGKHIHPQTSARTPIAEAERSGQIRSVCGADRREQERNTKHRFMETEKKSMHEKEG